MQGIWSNIVSNLIYYQEMQVAHHKCIDCIVLLLDSHHQLFTFCYYRVTWQWQDFPSTLSNFSDCKIPWILTGPYLLYYLPPMNYVDFHLVHPCDKKDNAGCQHECKKGEGKEFTCVCHEGFKLEEDGKTCEKSK